MYTDESRGTGLLCIEVVMTPLALLLTVIRVGVRQVNHQFGWDDASISIAMVCENLPE